MNNKMVKNLLKHPVFVLFLPWGFFPVALECAFSVFSVWDRGAIDVT